MSQISARTTDEHEPGRLNSSILVTHERGTIRRMSLKHSNPHLKAAASRRVALRLSAQTSSAVEGIRAPFAKGRIVERPESIKAFIAYWKRRVAATAR